MKITIVGLGHVGSTLAHVLVMGGMADELVLINRTHRRAVGDALDLAHAASLAKRKVNVRAGDVEASRNSDLVVLTASAVRPPPDRPPSRLAMAEENAKLFETLTPPLYQASPEAVFLVITNPVDVLVWVTRKLTGAPATRVVGLGTLIDSARFRSLLSTEFGVHSDDIRAYILGEHGDSQLAALSTAVVGGEPIGDTARIRELMEQTIRSGVDVMQAKGYTNFAVASAAAMVVETIALDLRRTLPLSIELDDYLGVSDVCLSVPVVLGRKGVCRVLHPPLAASEIAAFGRSATIVREASARAWASLNADQ